MEPACHIVGSEIHLGEFVVVSDEIVIPVGYEFVEREIVELDGRALLGAEHDGRFLIEEWNDIVWMGIHVVVEMDVEGILVLCP